jgi:hypothetical protein
MRKKMVAASCQGTATTPSQLSGRHHPAGTSHAQHVRDYCAPRM